MRNIILIKCFFMILFVISKTTFAAPGVTCSTVIVKSQNKNIILPGVDKPKAIQIFFVKNASKESLWLDHPVEHRSASAGWSSYIQPEKWSALLVSRKEFAISCAVIQPGKVNYQKCADVISVCIPKQASFESKRKGSYWLAENKSWDELLTALEKRGVKF